MDDIDSSEDITLTLSPLGDDKTKSVKILEEVNQTFCVAQIGEETTGVCSIFDLPEGGEVSVSVRVEDSDEEVTIVLLPLLRWMLVEDDEEFDEEIVTIAESDVSEYRGTNDVGEGKYIFIIKRRNEEYYD